GLDANDIDLEARLLHIEEELTVLIRSQYYFVTGGASLTRIPENPEEGSLRQMPFRKKEPDLKESFSFHQGRFSAANVAMVQQDSLPEINEFTALIQNPASAKDAKDAVDSSKDSAKASGYGSTDSVA
ncbi:hypothetical protein BBJ28_00019939, partial [Nothophytophthora sp. Chile5]